MDLKIILPLLALILPSLAWSQYDLYDKYSEHQILLESNDKKIEMWPMSDQRYIQSSPYKACNTFSKKDKMTIKDKESQRELSCRSIKNWFVRQKKSSSLKAKDYHESLEQFLKTYIHLISKTKFAQGSFLADEETLEMTKKMREFPYSRSALQMLYGVRPISPAFANKWVHMAHALFDYNWLRSIKTSKKIKGDAFRVFGKEVFDADAYHLYFSFINFGLYLTESVIYDESFIDDYYRDVMGPRPLVTILHEFIHSIDQRIKRPFFKQLLPWSWSNRKWHQLSKIETAPTLYALKNRRESMAEGMTAYILDPWYKCYSPKKYQYLSEQIKLNSNIFGSTTPYKEINCAHPEVQVGLSKRFEEVKKTFQTHSGSRDRYDLIIDGKVVLKTAGGYCKKDNECNNGNMGCDSEYTQYGLKNGRCRHPRYSGQKDQVCQFNNECESKKCSRNKCTE
jgi:hypothetical protein